MFKGVVIGNLAAEPERVTINNHEAVRIRVGASVGYGDRKTTIWCSSCLFGKPGEAMANYAHKGDTLHIVGDVFMREYTDKNGATKTAVDIQNASVEIVKRASGNSQYQQSASAAPARQEAKKPQPQPKPAPASSTVDLDDGSDDDLPF